MRRSTVVGGGSCVLDFITYKKSRSLDITFGMSINVE